MGKFTGFFTNHNETRDNHKLEELRSHYYKTSPKKALEAVKEMFETMDGYKVTSTSEDRGELGIKGKRSFIVATVIGVRPFETAVDFSVTTDTLLLPIDFGHSKKVINKLYQTLDTKLPYNGPTGNK
jgi:hypothetical protein